MSDQKKVSINIGKSIFIAILVIVVIIALFSSAYTIKAGQTGVLLTFGKASEQAIGEGLHFKLPFVQEIIKVDVKTQKYEGDAAAASKDLQTVSTRMAINYHLETSSVPQLYRDLGLDYQIKLIQPLEQEIVKATTAKFTAEELITRREEVRLEVKNVLHERLVERGIIVEEVSLVNFDFSPSFNAAIEAKVTAEQNALAEKNKLAAIEYQAQQRITQAQGEAEAIRIQAQSINAQGGKDYVQLQAINKWDGKLPQFTGAGAVPFINVGAQSQTA